MFACCSKINQKFQTSFASDPNLRLSIKLANILVLTVTSIFNFQFETIGSETQY